MDTQRIGAYIQIKACRQRQRQRNTNRERDAECERERKRTSGIAEERWADTTGDDLPRVHFETTESSKNIHQNDLIKLQL